MESNNTQNDFDDVSFYIGEEEQGFCTSESVCDSDISEMESEFDSDDDCSFDIESLANELVDEAVAKDLADSQEDAFDDISFYIGNKEEGFCTSESVCDSDISETDSEFDSDEDDDWSFDCKLLDDSKDASCTIGAEEGHCTFSPTERLSSLSEMCASEPITSPSQGFMPRESSFYCTKSPCHKDSMRSLPSLALTLGSECSSVRSHQLTNEVWSQATDDDKEIKDSCATPAEVGGALLLLTLWGTMSRANKTETTFHKSREMTTAR